MAENIHVIEVFRNSDSDQNTNSAAKSKVGVSIIKTEIVEESNNSAPELDGRNTPSDLIAVKNEDNSELKLENIIADSNTNCHIISDALQGASNNNRNVGQSQHKISKSYNEINLIQVNNQPLNSQLTCDDGDSSSSSEDDDDDDSTDDDSDYSADEYDDYESSDEDDKSTDEDEDDDEDEKQEIIYDTEYDGETPKVLTESEQDSDSDSFTSSTSSSSSLSSSNTTDSDSGKKLVREALINKLATRKSVHEALKNLDEVTCEDLLCLCIEGVIFTDLRGSAPESGYVAVGKVNQLMDKLVVIEAVKNTPILDLGSVLFGSNGGMFPIGHIYDVFGTATQSYYCVRLNPKGKRIFMYEVVYCAPKTKYTNYVFANAPMKIKEIYASRKHNDEHNNHDEFKYHDIWDIRWWEPLQPYIPPLPTEYDVMMLEYDLQQNIAAAENRDIVGEAELQEEWATFPERRERYCGQLF